MINVNNFFSQHQAIDFVCQNIKNSIEIALQHNNRASMILTGGVTCRNFLFSLSKLEIDWSKVWIILSDERWVPVTHEDSNEKQLKELFLKYLLISPNYISLKTKHNFPQEAIVDLEKKINDIPLPFDCSLLSMGDDGHVASLFPGNDWNNNIIWCLINNVYRVSLSINYFKKCLNNFVLIKKERKHILDDIQKTNDPSQPITHFMSTAIVF